MQDTIRIFFPVVTARSLAVPRNIAALIEPLFLIETHMTFEERCELFRTARRLPAGFRALEIGSYLGASTAFLALAAHLRDGRVDAIDTWANDAMGREPTQDTHGRFLANIHAWRHYVRPIRAHSAAAALTYTDPLDLLFIDGDHSYEGALADLRGFAPRLKKGGWLAMHDFTYADVRRAFDEAVGDARVTDLSQTGSLMTCRLAETMASIVPAG